MISCEVCRCNVEHDDAGNSRTVARASVAMCRDVSLGWLALFTIYHPSSHGRKARLQQHHHGRTKLARIYAYAQRKCDPSTIYIAPRHRQAGASQRISGPDGSAAAALAQQDAFLAGDAHLSRQPRASRERKTALRQLRIASHVALDTKPSRVLAIAAALPSPRRLRRLGAGAGGHVREPRG
jgi:hypothetical protein